MIATQGRINRELAKTGACASGREFNVPDEAKRKWDRLRDMRKRHPGLLAKEGWYDVKGVEALTEDLRQLLLGWDQRTKPTRWLLRQGRITQQQASELGDQLNLDSTIRFRLSCRHKDLLRVAETDHYKTCYGTSYGGTGWRGIQMLRFLIDPDMGVLYIPDKSGNFLWRAFVRLVFMPKSAGYGLFVYRTYGNANEMAILSKLNGIIPVFRPEEYCPEYYDVWSGKGKRLDENKLYSASLVSNPVITKVVWSDHAAIFDETRKRITMWGVPLARTRK